MSRITEPTVSVSYFRALLEFAIAKGAERAALLTHAQVNSFDLQDADNRLPLASYVALMHAAKDLCADPALPLQLGATENFDQISVVGLLCYSAPTMGEALLALNRFGYLVAELDVPKHGERFRIARNNGEVWLIDTRLNSNSFPELTEETWARFIAETNRGFPDQPFVKEVHVTHTEPEHSDAYARLIRAPVIFESNKNALLINESWLSIELNNPNNYVFGVLSEHAERLLDELRHTNTVRAQVESLIIPRLHQGDLSTNMNLVASELGLSRQTLYRRLKQEGTSYEKLLDELRHRMALHYLGGEKASVIETAYLVGYSDPGAFSRAFKRWTGERPGKKRAHIKELE